jgi:hypothetical protein
MKTDLHHTVHQTDISAGLLSATLLVFANIFLFATLSVYVGSPEEFEVGYIDMLSSQWWRFALIFLLLLLPGLVSNRAFANKYVSFLFVLGVLTWFQGGFLLWDYGVFDGRNFSWSQYDVFGWLDIALWLGLLLVSIRFAGRILPLVVMVSWILLTGQLVLVYNQAKNSEGYLKKDHIYSSELPGVFLDLSSKQNVIHFVLDSFQTDIFLQLIEESDLHEEFSGFTLFYENAGVTPHTSIAIPAIFSGQLFDGSQSPADYYQESIRDGFQSTLYNKGYTVNLIPKMSMRTGSFSNHFQILSNYRGVVDDLKRRNTAQLIDVALFRSSPHFLRKFIFDDGNWLLLPIFRGKTNIPSIVDKTFLEDYIQGVRVGTDAPAYHFIHIKPPHPPYVTLADGSYAGEILPNTRENFLNESRPVIDLMRLYIDKLKSLGIYDNALIVLQGDHGSEIKPVVNGEEIRVCLRRSTALLVVKPPGATGVLKVSNTQTNILDIAPTILAYAGEPTTSVFELDPNQQRQRSFLIVDSRKEKPRVSYYSINGSVFDPKSCKEEERLTVAIERPVYEYGAKIQFGMTGNGDSFMGAGWSACDESSCWSNGHLSVINLPIGASSEDLDLHVRLIPLVIKPKIPRQRIRVSVNGNQLAEWVGTENKVQNFTLQIPAAYVTDKELQISFEFPDAVRPNLLDLGGDRRLLGAGLVSLRLDVAGGD